MPRCILACAMSLALIFSLSMSPERPAAKEAVRGTGAGSVGCGEVAVSAGNFLTAWLAVSDHQYSKSQLRRRSAAKCH